MQHAQPNSPFARHALAAGWLEGIEFSLLDIGASGGIASFWNQFRPNLRALGIDPLVAEVDRLNALETDPKIVYRAAWVGSGQRASYPPDTRHLFEFTSAGRAERQAGRSYAERVFNRGDPLVRAPDHVTVDELVQEGAVSDPDVVKIDVDFFEGAVLEGARKTFRTGRSLVIDCECGFHDLVGASWPAFAEVDAALRQAGYRLLDLEPMRYRRSTLPSRFLYDIPAASEHGQVLFCDALWFLDPSVDDAALERLRTTPGKLAKLILLIEAYGYPDVAAAILDRLIAVGAVPPGLDATAALDALTPANPFGANTHAAYLAAFDEDPKRFLPAGWNAADRERRLAEMHPLAGVVDGTWIAAYPDASVAKEAAGIRVRTAPIPWSYAAVLPIEVAQVPGEDFIVELCVRLGAGVAYATLATSDLSMIGDQIRIEGAAEVVIRLQSSRGDRFTRLLLRNGERAESTDMLITVLRCFG